MERNGGVPEIRCPPNTGKGSPAVRIRSLVWHCNPTATINYKLHKGALNVEKPKSNGSIGSPWGERGHAPEYLFAVNCACGSYLYTGVVVDHDCNCRLPIGKPSQLHRTNNSFE